jgi:hypothetical protein
MNRRCRAILESLTLRIAVLAFAVVWFVAIVPGHTRGKITWTGVQGKTLVKHNCCDDDAPSKTPCDTGEPSAAAKKQCAVCYYTLGMSVSPVFTFDVVPTGRVAKIVIAWSEQVRSIEKFDSFRSRDPPAASV